ncbi:MAG: DHA2 family efflux MFS transporter permease subunit [Chloroflexota bacterium]
MVAVALPARAATSRLAALPYYWQAVIVIALGSFMVFLNMTVVNVALPRIIQVFQGTVGQGQLVLTSYMVALAVVAPTSGYFSDTFGAKRTYLASVAMFTVGTALCGLSLSIESLIVFRVFQGIGGAMILPLGQAILFQVVPPEKRGTVMGIYGFPLLTAPMLGPAIGGYLVEFVDWRLIFAVGAPAGALAILLGSAILRELPLRPAGTFDWAGFILAGVGFSTALLGLSMAPTEGWTSPPVLALGAAAALALPAFVIVELAREHPMLDLRILLNRTYSLAMVLTGITTIAMFSSMFLLPLFLQNTRGVGPLTTGLLLIPQAATASLVMPITGRLFDRFGPAPLVVPGLFALTYATWMLAGIDPDMSDGLLAVALVLRGIAMGTCMMPVNTVSMDSVPRPKIARAAALTNVLRQLFGAFGTCVFATLLADRQFYHQAMLAQTINDTNISAVQMLSDTKLNLVGQGWTEANADTAGLIVLARQVRSSAAVHAYDDCFIVAALVALVGVVPALFLRRARRSATAPTGRQSR